MQEQQTKKCPFCAEEINIEATKCKHCGEIIDKKKLKDVEKNLDVGIGCLIIIILFIIIISLSGCGSSDDYNSSDINNSSLNTSSNSESTKTQPSTKQSTELLELISTGTSREYGYCEITGLVKNISDKPLDNIEAVVNFLDADGNFIKFDSALIEYNPILPNQTSPFSVMTTDNPEIEAFNINFKYLMGGTILMKDSRK